MSTTSLIPAAQSKALLREIEHEADAAMRGVTAKAEQEAQTILGNAHAVARRRMREAIAALRAEGSRRIGRAGAQLETDARQRAQHDDARAVDRAWPLLLDTLTARWADPQARSAWVEGLVRHVQACLRTGPLRVEHPAEWCAEEQQRLRDVLGDRAVTFTAAADIAAGLRIHADHAVLDGTPKGLLADEAGTAGLLLAEMEQPAATQGAQIGATAP